MALFAMVPADHTDGREPENDQEEGDVDDPARQVIIVDGEFGYLRQAPSYAQVEQEYLNQLPLA